LDLNNYYKRNLCNRSFRYWNWRCSYNWILVYWSYGRLFLNRDRRGPCYKCHYNNIKRRLDV